METKPIRPYIPLVYGSSEARAELECSPNEVTSLPSQVANLLLEKRVTPLQAQAVLVRAWEVIQQKGCLSLRDYQPNQKEWNRI